MEEITHKIRFKSGDQEIEVIGTRKFTENWFEKLIAQLETGMPAAGPGSGKAAPRSIVDGIMAAAYDLQEKRGKAHLVSKDILREMRKAKMQAPKNSQNLSVAIINNIKKGYLQRTGKIVGKQKAFCVSEKGKRFVEGGFKKRK